jgi:amino-acid N-acetyltransferase
MASEIIRRAEARDLEAIVAIVAGASLPVNGVREFRSEFFVSVRDGRVVGCCGLELYGGDALLRSVAVLDDERGRGTGARLVARALADARGRSLRSIALLTTTASGYFARFGFREVGREVVPAAVRASAEFRSVCPSTAACMLLVLDPAGSAVPAPE